MKSRIDIFYDLFDQAAMLHYQVLGLGYLDALLRVSEGLLDGNIDSRFNDEDTDNLEKIYYQLSETEFINEEIRQALQLLIVKAFKHDNLSLDLMTPDTVNYLFIKIINELFQGRKISILDTLLGTGNLLLSIHHHYHNDLNLIGIEKDQKLIKLAKASADLQNTEVKIYLQDAIDDIYEYVDLVIGDLESYYLEDNLIINNKLYKAGVRYFPYLLISQRLSNLQEGGYFIYLIDNDFFSQEKNEIFKKELEKVASIPGLITLPETMFQKGHPGRSILIGKKSKSFNEIAIVEIASFEKESLKKSFNKIQIMIERIAEAKKCTK